MQKLYILNIAQYCLGYFEIFLCFRVLLGIYKKDSTKVEKFMILLACGILASIEAINRNIRLYSIILIVFLIITISIIFKLLCKVKFLSTLLYAALYCFSLALMDLFIIFTMGIVLCEGNFGIIIGRKNSLERILALFLARFLMLLVYVLLVKVREYISKKYINALLIILFAEVLGVFYFQSIYAGDSISDLAKDYYAYLIIIILAIIAFAIYSIYRSSLEENKIVKLRNNMLEQNYEELKSYYNDSRTLFHDYKAHITLLQKYLQENQIEKARMYLDSINKPLSDLEKKICTGNNAIDLVINYKLSEVKEKEIDIKYDISSVDISKLCFEEGDIFVILYNLFDNAIEACEKVPKSERWIFLSLRHINDMFMICIRNSYAIQPRYENGEIVTLKKDKQFHGIGMRSVKKIVEKYEGRLEYESDKNVFEVSITLF